MTEAERIAICKAIIVSCMWGQGGIASVLAEELDARLPSTPTWSALLLEHGKDARRQAVGVIHDAEKLQSYLNHGFWLANWDDYGCSLMNPPPMNGLAAYVSKELANIHRESRR